MDSNYFSAEQSKAREQIIAELLGKEILESGLIQRLRNVSFLGVLNFAARVPESLRFNRYEHSISVAYLTMRYCENLGLPEHIKLQVTLAALLHDVGHAPFSHSTEVFLHQKAKSQHSHASTLQKSKIKKTLKEGLKSLPAAIIDKKKMETYIASLPVSEITTSNQKEKELDFLSEEIFKLLHLERERREFHQDIVEIFDTPFCPDTFDGINRAWYALQFAEIEFQSAPDLFKLHKPIDPELLIRFISSIPSSPLVFQSNHPPTEKNLIYRFADLTQVLYNNVIYSHWQSSSMVMFARALEIAYADNIGQIGLSSKTDDSVKEKIKKNKISQKIFGQIILGENFSCLSEQNPDLHQRVLKEFWTKYKVGGIKASFLAKQEIENMVASKLGIDSRGVFCHIHRPLIWSRENVWFKNIDTEAGLWLLKWESSEGTPAKEPSVEVYYMNLSIYD